MTEQQIHMPRAMVSNLDGLELGQQQLFPLLASSKVHQIKGPNSNLSVGKGKSAGV